MRGRTRINGYEEERPRFLQFLFVAPSTTTTPETATTDPYLKKVSYESPKFEITIVI